MMCSEKSKCFRNRYNADWPFRSEPSGDHDLPTAAVYSARDLWSLLYSPITFAVKKFNLMEIKIVTVTAGGKSVTLQAVLVIQVWPKTW